VLLPRTRREKRSTRAPAAPAEPTSPRPVPSLGNGLATPITPQDYPALLETLRAEYPPEPDDAFFVGWDGIRTRVDMLPFAPPELAGVRSDDLPIPDDGYRSEDAEYVALAQALATAEDTFRIVEVGAGWAPWSVAGIAIARRHGLDAQGIAVEADPERSTWALTHAADNGIHAESITGSPEQIAEQLSEPWGDVELRVVRAAGWHSPTYLQFPDLDEGDMGGAVWTLPGTDVDYRGAHLTHHTVPAVSIDTLLNANSATDLLHIDVQGVEFDLIEPACGTIQDNVRLMAVGTTDRLTEGRLQQLLLPRGWGLTVDVPCTAVFSMTHPSLAGFTVQDGTQLWENPFLRPDFPQAEEQPIARHGLRTAVG
jgi:FkbM family methyltransferase